jgi:hypothetical protein
MHSLTRRRGRRWMVKAAEEVLEETTFLEKKVGLFFGHV